MIAARTIAISVRTVDPLRLLLVLVRCTSCLQSSQRDVASPYVVLGTPTICTCACSRVGVAEGTQDGPMSAPTQAMRCLISANMRPRADAPGTDALGRDELNDPPREPSLGTGVSNFGTPAVIAPTCAR